MFLPNSSGLFEYKILSSQASVTLPQVASFEPYTPRVILESKKVTAAHAFANYLKEHMSEILKQPLAARLPMMMQPGKCAGNIQWGIFTFRNVS